ncbi:gas vesicle protein [Pseudofrankia inefficax]|uniref:Gas vesicle protein GVPa n=1 Tax=Pseudofrankia inefficax (strain DSM 45817 / CECT 9037 / DDB 130130 / EuI1c) TaxID=298654 RepID=E3J8E8_PSEI1|nr:gas vesicle protein [Pseudofrankia inefficax]ADP84482.1 gas vesicle protein GVPa [Pseudofrankia inefficax]
MTELARQVASTAGATNAGRPGRRASLGSGRGLSDLLDRLVDSGAVVTGDVIIGLAGVDLIRLDLRLLLIGAQSAIEAGAGAELRPGPAPPGRPRPDHAGEVVEGAVVRPAGADRRQTGPAAGGRAEP